jgi:gas vesicle protein
MSDEATEPIGDIVPVEGVELDPEESPYAATDEAPQQKRRRGFRLGVTFGIIAGAIVALIFRPSSGGQQEAPAIASGASGDGSTAGMRARLREAAAEAKRAAREAEEAKRARFSELIEKE